MDIEDLIVVLEVRDQQLQTALKSTNQKIDDFAKQSTKAGGAAASAFNGVGAAVSRLAGPAVLGLLTKGLYDGVVAALEYADTISDVSAQLNMTAESYQELSFAAKQSGMEQSEFNLGVRQMNNLIGQAITGNKEAAAKFTDLGISIAQIKDMRPEDSFMLISNALKNVESDTQRASAAAEIFGGRVGAGMANMAKNGADGIKALREEARSLGIVMSEDVVKNAGEMNDKFEAAKQVIGVEFKNMMLELAPVLITIVQWIAKGANALNDWMAGFKEVKNLSLEQKREELREINAELEQLKNAAAVEPFLPSTERWGAGIAYEAALARKKELERSIRASRPGRGGMPSSDITPDGKPTFASKNEKPKDKEVKDHIDAQLAKEQADAEYFEKLRLKYMDDDTARQHNYDQSLIDLTVMLEQGVISYEEYLRDKKQLDDDYNEDLMRGLEEIVVSHKKLGDSLMDEFRSSFDVMLDNWMNSSERMEGIFGDLFESISDDLVEGKGDWDDYLKYVLKALLKIQLQKMMAENFKGGSGGIGGFIGSLFGRAGGGSVNAGQMYKWQERVPEVFVPHTAGRVVRADAMTPARASAPSVTIINNGTPQKVDSVRPTQTGQDAGVQILLSDLNKGGPISKAFENTYGVRRRAR